MQCSKCFAEFRDDTGLYTTAGQHIRLDCPACGAFIKFVRKPMNGEPADQIVPFGRYNGQTLGQILAVNRGYVEYIAKGSGTIASAARMILQ
jgi:hypothetical protein